MDIQKQIEEALYLSERNPQIHHIWLRHQQSIIDQQIMEIHASHIAIDRFRDERDIQTAEIEELKEFQESVADEYDWMTRLLNSYSKSEKRLEAEIARQSAIIERYETTLTEEGYDIRLMILEAEAHIEGSKSNEK